MSGLIGRAVRSALGALLARRPSTGSRPAPASGYPGDFTGRTELSYAPHDDGIADPGEVVWTWVPYEEDFRRGKDRPVLVVGRDRGWLLAVPMTSKDHDRDAGQEAAQGRFWHDIGSGSWDSSGRASEVRVNRIVRIDPGAVRRIAARLDQARFESVAQAIRAHW
ncbi:PemK-like, MazF-like toxin of type II toxin-antitoxin system [Propionicimonas paludicola]|uniref:PemK-like, MazF-like toxin of type II toxin-antitoxin system n=1 Tax=Propionicimonas paludicola TaxID=185243 RepID=A0A2A9CMJ1_9ACTN|nr:type II toxin-antitoxin system PemK/MazF family toxin [Propionicimonas paludicola]PFG15624.1 PemK-like, MazF-like toxin of type II toxin-antitoxin system [Propionicimonas paludicola]